MLGVWKWMYLKYFGIGIGIGIWETFSESESYLGTSTCQGGLHGPNPGVLLCYKLALYPSCYWASLCVCMAWPLRYRRTWSCRLLRLRITKKRAKSGSGQDSRRLLRESGRIWTLVCSSGKWYCCQEWRMIRSERRGDVMK
ncbi:hypothetical protein FVEG_15345 [Fusarium verticillioides 7600]|uniref:Uncharacterized protein n=1 Tax=Gibberella moniliformis (strain M3125 / FGSC 7600) TaxID=334819 RepID=W7LTC1_GIBM7|nr:hypothetical protein FVEG_15345 [Fusarium verticillioides 7600]EWG41826.1 hypothetical protein FVEG_15345 [Fusarium verticillioides 7600]